MHRVTESSDAAMRDTASAISPDRDAPLPFVKNFRAIFIGRLLSALSMWLALVILAKMADPTVVGMYALAQATCIPLGEIAKMGLRELHSSDVAGEFDFSDYFGLRVIATAVAFGAMIWVGVLQSNDALVLQVILLFAVARCIEVLADIIYSLFQAQERMDFTGWSLSATGLLSLAGLTLGYLLTGSLLVALAGQIAAHLGVCLFYSSPMARRRVERVPGKKFAPAFRLDVLLRLAIRALPLTIALVMNMTAQHLPRLAVEHELGLAALGIFAPILALAMAPDRLVNSVGTALSVKLARRFEAGQIGSFARILIIVTGAVSIACAFGLAACYFYGGEILGFVYTEDYAGQGDVLFLVALAASCRLIGNFLGFGLIAARRFWWLTIQSSSVATLAIAGCLFLIPAYGLIGAGYAILLISIAHLVVICVGLAMTLIRSRPAG